jgi:hypothetical protein
MKQLRKNGSNVERGGTPFNWYEFAEDSKNDATERT